MLLGVGTKRLRSQRSERTKSKQALNTEPARLNAQITVTGRGVRPQLGHVTQYQPATAG